MTLSNRKPKRTVAKQSSLAQPQDPIARHNAAKSGDTHPIRERLREASRCASQLRRLLVDLAAIAGLISALWLTVHRDILT